MAVVNQALARAVFGSASAVGQRFRRQATPRDPEEVFEVVGVVEDTKYRELREADAADRLHGRFAQDPSPSSFAQLLIRTAGAPEGAWCPSRSGGVPPS